MSSFCQELLRKERRGRREKEVGERKRKERERGRRGGGRRAGQKKTLRVSTSKDEGICTAEINERTPCTEKGREGRGVERLVRVHGSERSQRHQGGMRLRLRDKEKGVSFCCALVCVPLAKTEREEKGGTEKRIKRTF